MKLSVNLEIVFGCRGMEGIGQILDEIKGMGISVFEIWNHRFFDVPALKKEAEKRGMHISCISGNRNYNLLEEEDRQGLFAELLENIDAVRQLGGKNVSMLSETLDEDTLATRPTRRVMSDSKKLLSLYKGLKTCAEIGEEQGVYLSLETLNSRVDHAGYFCDNMDKSMALIQAVNSPYLRSLFDIYHLQIMEGNIISQLEKYLPWIGVIHVADVPGRHEPGTGEINYKNIARCLKANGYDGYVVLEGSPSDGDPRTSIEGFLNAFNG